jgi:MoxR-like ATPase
MEENNPTMIDEGLMNRARGLESEIARAVVGQSRVIHEIMLALLSAGHVLVEGVPGLGKTLLVRSLAAAVQGEFSRIQFTPDLMPSDISGHIMFDMKSDNFRVRKGPVFCNLLLADEINRSPAKTQSALLEAMQEQQVTIEGRTFPLTPPFLVLATQNPIEQEGTYPLPQAQLDRFLLKVLIDYPDEEEEQRMVRQVTHGAVADQLDTSAVRPIMKAEEIPQVQTHVAQLQMDDEIVNYAVRLVRAAREWNGIDAGPGPRGTISLLRAARAEAFLQQRDFVTPDDVKAAALPVLRHRIRLSTDLEIENTPLQSRTELIELLANNLKLKQQINLLQGEYKKVDKLTLQWKRWLPAAILAAVAIALTLALNVADYYSYQRQSAELDTQIRQVFKQAFPNIKRIVDPKVQMEQQLKVMRGGSKGGAAQFASLFVPAASVIQTSPNTKLENISFRDGHLDLQLTIKELQALEKLKKSIEEKALKVEIRTANASGNQVTSHLRISGGGR